MNIKLTGLVLGTALSAMAFTACQSTGTNTNTNVTRVNSNTAVVVNSNNNALVTTTNTTTTRTNTWNANMTREEYNRDRTRYESEKGSSTIGQGANDSWLWFKTRAALATTNELRESTINVDVVNDVITLKGTVANAAEKAKAEQVAKGIEGQKGVKNELKVAPNDSMTNTNMTSNANANTRR